ncbi:DUF935 family protein [Pyruvatibacter sp.]|uniref:DUF935 domain-containing protein n=1 Tax=Pyruvatibacter sp. TaxID=1981328 RepID=UPI0032EEC60B
MADTTQDGKATRPDLNEIATSADGRDITRPFTQALLTNDDTVLAARGGGLELYEEVLRDTQVYSCFQQRRLAVVSAELEVEAGADDKASQMAADMVRENLRNILFDQACNRMAYGIFYGYAIGEMMWAKDGANFVIDAIKVRRARRFRYDRDGGLRLLTLNNMHDGELMPARKFWTFVSGAEDDDTPYGRGLAHYCYWPAFFKRHTLKFWLTFLDKYGGPTAVGKYPPGSTKEEMDRLLAAVTAMRSDSAVIMPEGMAAELIEATRSGGASFELMYDRLDASISKAILSQTMTTDDGSSKSQSETHMDVREDVVKADSDLQCASFNQGPVKWLTEWNYPGATPPRVWRAVEPPEDLDQLADRDTKIYGMGFKPTEAYVKDTYGEGWEPDPDRTPALQAPPHPPVPGSGKTTRAGSADFAEPLPTDAIQEAADNLDDDWEEIMAPIIDPIRARIDKADTLEEVRDTLINSIEDMDEAAFAEHLGRLGFEARIAGMVGAPLSDDDEVSG